MMHGHEKSDPAIVAVKPANKAERSAAELVERRAGTKGNAVWQSTRRTQSRISVSQAPDRMRQLLCRLDPRWEPYAGKPHVRICAGGREVTRVPTAKQAALLHLLRSGSGRYCCKTLFALLIKNSPGCRRDQQALQGACNAQWALP